MSSFGTEPNSYLSDDDLLCLPEDLGLPVETIPTLAPKTELTTEEQIALLREMQERQDAARQQATREAEARRKVVRFASPNEVASSGKPRRPSTNKRRQTGLRRLNGPQ